MISERTARMDRNDPHDEDETTVGLLVSIILIGIMLSLVIGGTIFYVATS